MMVSWTCLQLTVTG